MSLQLMENVRSGLMALMSFNVILHAVGIYLLVSVYRSGNKTPQIIFLLNMSCAEVLTNVGKLIMVVVEHLVYAGVLQQWAMTSGQVFMDSMIILMSTGVDYLYLFSMFYITGDRLACVLLSIRYRSVWSHNKAKKLVAATWAFNLLVCIGLPLLYHYYFYLPKRSGGQLFYQIINVYLTTAIQCVFIVFAVVSYCVMFQKYVTSRRTTRRMSQPDGKQESLYQIFRNSQFFVPVILITSTIILGIVPNLLYTFVLLIGKLPIDNAVNRDVQIARNFCTMLSDAVDGLIYVIFQPSVRKLLVGKMSGIRRVGRRNDLNKSQESFRTENVEMT